MPDPELIAAIDQDGQAIIKELTRYAHIKVRVYNLPPEDEGDDIVQKSLERIYKDKRNWNKSRYPTPLDFLKSVVDSVVSNRKKSKRGKEADQTHGLEIEVDQELSEEDRRKMLEEALIEIAIDDDELFNVLDGRLSGKKRSEIAEDHGMTPDDVTNATKRLYRKIEAEFDTELIDSHWSDHVG